MVKYIYIYFIFQRWEYVHIFWVFQGIVVSHHGRPQRDQKPAEIHPSHAMVPLELRLQFAGTSKISKIGALSWIKGMTDKHMLFKENIC